MNPISIELSQHQTPDLCQGDSALIRDTGRFQAAMLTSLTPLLPEQSEFPDIPVLLVNCDKGQDPASVQSMSDPGCKTGTFRVTVRDRHTLLGIFMAGPVFTLAVIIDPHTPPGRSFLERWHATGRMLFSLRQQSSWAKVVELTCTAGASALLTRAAPAGADDSVSVAAIELSKIHAELQGTLGPNSLILVAASDAATERSQAQDETISFLSSIAPTKH